MHAIHVVMVTAALTLLAAQSTSFAQPRPFGGPPGMEKGFQRPGPPGGPQGEGRAAMPAGAALPFEYVDVHVHPVPDRSGLSSLSEALGIASEARIGRMVLMPTPQSADVQLRWDYEAFLAAVRQNPGRLAFLGGGGSLNQMILEAAAAGRVDEGLRARFEKRAREILADGASGFGELTAHHLSFMPGHPYETVPADHPLFLLLADISGEAGAVIDLHFDVVVTDLPRPARLGSPNPETLAANLPGFERLLAHNRKARIVWAHAGADPLGHWTPRLSRELLSRHPNLYMSIRMGGEAAGMQNALLVQGSGLDPAWLDVLIAFPDRFVLGGDQFLLSGASRGGPGAEFAKRAPMQRRMQAALLSRLPPELARRIGYENALRLYKFKD
jgi:hypothetical protein